MHAKHENQSIHTIAIVGRDGVGKSRLVDGLLKIQQKKAEKSVIESPEEISRNYTVYNHFYHFDHGNFCLNLIDTPGNTNFLPKVNVALSIATGAVFVISGAGTSESSFRIWETILKNEIPRVIFINMMDLPEANFENTLHGIEQGFSINPTVLFIPWFDDDKLIGLIDIINKKLILGGGTESKIRITDIPKEADDDVQLYREMTLERLAELDDELMELFIEGKELPSKLVKKALKEGVQSRQITPILVGTGKGQIGVDILNEFVENNFSSHTDKAPWIGKVSNSENADYTERKLSSDEPFSAVIFKTLHERYMGKLSFLLIVSGKLSKGMKVLNSSNLSKIQVGKLSILNGDTLEEIEEAYPGDIIIIEKEESFATNQTICDPNTTIYYDPIPFMVPRCTYRMEFPPNLNEDRIMSSMQKIIAEDPSLRLHKNDDTNELLLSGMGLMHLEITREHLKNVYDVEIELKTPNVAFRETITKEINIQGKYKKQSGGHGQYGDVHLKLEPLPRNGGFEFVNKIVGGVIPKNYIPAVEKGVKEALMHGYLGNFPVVDVKVTLFDGSFHSVDSSDFAFQQAGILAIRKALPEAKPVILEPIMEMEIDVPEHEVGKVSKDLGSRRGKVIRYDSKDFTSQIIAEAPLSELMEYSTALRGMTQGLGLYTMYLKAYEVLTSHLAAKILTEKNAE